MSVSCWVSKNLHYSHTREVPDVKYYDVLDSLMWSQMYIKSLPILQSSLSAFCGLFSLLAFFGLFGQFGLFLSPRSIKSVLYRQTYETCVNYFEKSNKAMRHSFLLAFGNLRPCFYKVKTFYNHCKNLLQRALAMLLATHFSIFVEKNREKGFFWTWVWKHLDLKCVFWRKI